MIGARRPSPLNTWSKSRYAQISRLLDELLALSFPERAAWLEALGRREPELAADLRNLFEPVEGRAGGILAAAEDLGDQLAALPPAGHSLVGRRFGPYCVHSLLGHGGMGSVWLAERVDGLFTRRVALKLVHPALMGLGLAERLSRERAILASLDHPNIARLYDAGLAEDGQPYLALEYIPGTPLGTHCDRRQLGVRGRLLLFRQVLAAVQYAHAHLVIHRDLKPSNILVTDEGRVCLLDFGIAKLFQDGVALETELTRLSGRALSLEYASPEQIVGAPITIAADVYSLGVMLYELLSGQSPYRLARRSRATLEEAILASDPVPLGRAIVEEGAAAARAASVIGLTRTLRGDLDTIVMKALRKPPADRYATVDALSEDLAHWLRNEPILARRHRLSYRAAKFVRRHWAALAVASAFILALMGGLAATSYEASVAARQRDAALRAQLQSLTQTAAARLSEGDAATALGIAIQLLRRESAQGADFSAALAIFQEARAVDSQVLTLTARMRLPEADSTSIEYSPDGRRILTEWGGRSATVWDAGTGHGMTTFREGKGTATATLEDAVFSPDGQRILLLWSDRVARIRDVQTGRVLVELRGHTDRVIGAAFSPDGRRVVTASWDKTARIWDATTGLELLRLVHEDKVYTALFSSDGRRVVTGSHDESVHVWDATTGRETLRLSGLGEAVFAAAFSHDGRRLVTASGNSARVWDARTGKLVLPLTGHHDIVTNATFSPDDRFVLTASEDHTARIWDTTYGRQVAVLVHPGRVWEAEFSPDGRYIATMSPDGTARVWRNPLEAQSSRLVRLPEQVSAAAFSPDGKRFLTASFDRVAVIWDARTARPLVTLRSQTDRLWCAAFSRDGHRVVTGSRDGTVLVWDAATGRELLQLKGHTGGVHGAGFSPDGQRIVTASYDKTARIWDAATGRELVRLEGHSDLVASAVFSPDSRRVVTASSDNTARIWDADTGRELPRLQGHTGGVGSAAFSPDGRRVVTASDDRTARIWDAATGKQLVVLSGHEDSVSDAEFSADGLRIVTASRDRSVRVWESATGHVLAVFKGHDDQVESAAFSGDGSRIISASEDGTARIWDARIPALEQQLSWAEAAQFDPLAPSLRAATEFPRTAARIPSRVIEAASPLVLARQGEAAERAALGARTESERAASLLQAFGLFAAAAARAERAGWPDDASRQWRYRRASLARVLASAGMMPQVAQVYERTLREYR
jgi:WD40 repeat protein/tRNA A-37 threonylcarbamoyl transferase component Bud32